MIAATLRQIADAIDPPEHTGLVAALRTLGAAALLKAGGSAEALLEAADRIEDLEKDNAKLRDQVQYWLDNHSAELWNAAREHEERWRDYLDAERSRLRVEHEKLMIDAWLKTPAGWEKSTEPYGIEGKQRIVYSKNLGTISAVVYPETYRNTALNQVAWQARDGTETLRGHADMASEAIVQANRAFDALVAAERARKEALKEGLKGA